MRETIQNANGKQFYAVSLSGGKDSTAIICRNVAKADTALVVLHAALPRNIFAHLLACHGHLRDNVQ